MTGMILGSALGALAASSFIVPSFGTTTARWVTLVLACVLGGAYLGWRFPRSFVER